MPNKTVTFGGVFHNKSATLPNPKTQKSTPDVLETKNDKDKSMIKKGFNCVGNLRNSFKMVSDNGSTIISIRLIRSKLRKRDDSNLSPETPPNTNHNNNIIQPDVVVSANTSPAEPPPFLWLYSSKNNLAPPASTTTSSQYTLYNNDQDVLVHGSSCEDTRKCNGSATGGGGHGLKKNLGGKWKKLVKKKASQEAYTIPAELKDQLKQIYVY